MHLERFKDTALFTVHDTKNVPILRNATLPKRRPRGKTTRQPGERTVTKIGMLPVDSGVDHAHNAPVAFVALLPHERGTGDPHARGNVEGWLEEMM